MIDMDLKQLFHAHHTRVIAQMARQAGTSMPYLQQCKDGRRRLSADLALKLEAASGGVLTARELRPDLPWPVAPYSPAGGSPALKSPDALFHV